MKSLTGTIQSGVGEGDFYLSMDYYAAKIMELLGFEVFPGTLNILVDEQKAKAFISQLKPLLINGFTENGKLYGAVTCYKVMLNNEQAAIIVPEKTRHPENIIEIIAPFHVKHTFNLKDGDKIVIEM